MTKEQRNMNEEKIEMERLIRQVIENGQMPESILDDYRRGEYKGNAWIYNDVEIQLDELMKGKSYEGWEEFLPVIKRLLTLPNKRDFSSLLHVDESDGLTTLYGTTLDGIQILAGYTAEDLSEMRKITKTTDLQWIVSIVNAQHVSSLDRFKSGVMDSLFHRKPRLRISDDVDDEFLHVYDQGYSFGMNLDFSLNDNDDERDIKKELYDLDIYNIVPALHTEGDNKSYMDPHGNWIYGEEE